MRRTASMTEGKTAEEGNGLNGNGKGREEGHSPDRNSDGNDKESIERIREETEKGAESKECSAWSYPRLYPRPYPPQFV